MIPLTLPVEERRVFLRSFWIVIAVGCGAATWGLASLLRLPFAPILGLVPLAAFLAVPFANERIARRIYGAWNRRVAERIGRITNAVILRICLFIVFAAVGRGGSRFRLQVDSNASLWSSKRKVNDVINLMPAQAATGWIRPYIGWAWRSGNAWAVVLIPFFCLLRMTSTEQQRAAEGNIYTLF